MAILKLQHSLPDLPHLITLPVKYKGKVVGSIFAAKSKGDTFTNTGTEFLHGICHILESIYESEKLKEEENLLAEAEIRALQAQINPHFLYNTLNTISYYVRSDPETARRLIQYLSDYFRHSLNNPSKLIPLFGERSGLHIISRKGRGTLVFTNIPKVTAEEEKAAEQAEAEEKAAMNLSPNPTV